MRHGVKTSKLQRNASHRRALLANQACSLILNGRITTTLAKAKALRPYVEKLITLLKPEPSSVYCLMAETRLRASPVVAADLGSMR